MFEIKLDQQVGVVRVHITGLMSPAEAREFHAAITTNAPIARSRFGSFRLLADTREAPVQSQDVLELLPTPAQIITGPRDRWAVIVGSSLAKMQASRVLAHPQAKAFLSANAAELWLNAYEAMEG